MDTVRLVVVMLVGLGLAPGPAVPRASAAEARGQGDPVVSDRAEASDVGAGVVDAIIPASAGGVARLDPLLARLAGHRRMLMIAAHPDDEDTRLLAHVSRGLGGEAAYLSLSRGEGGQNLIGPELGVGLGLIRSRELEAARAVDGGRQFFTRAYDFGYTRSLEETLGHWPEEALLEDAVRVVRRFKPQLLVAVWPSDARAGHGQHQASGYIAERLAAAAADPAAFPEAGPPWRVEVVDRLTWGDPEATQQRVDVATLEPLSGRSTTQIAMASRSRHRSQDMGVLESLGTATSALQRLSGPPITPGDGDLFAGIDTRLAAIAALLAPGGARDALASRLARAAKLAQDARARLAPARPAQAVEPLTEIAGLLDAARSALADGADEPAAGHVRTLLAEKRALVDEALAAAAGIAVDAWTDVETLVPGEEAVVHAELWAPVVPPTASRTEVRAPAGWSARVQDDADDSSGFFRVRPTAHERFVVTAADAATPSAPAFLDRPRHGELYDWASIPPSRRGEPFGPPVLRVRWDLTVAGVAVRLEREVVHRTADQAIGEVRHPLRVLPRFAVGVEPSLVVWPLGRQGEPSVAVTVEAFGTAEERANGARLEVADETGRVLTVVPLALSATARRQELRLALDTPDRAGVHRYQITLVDALGDRYNRAYPVLEAPHIRATPMPVDAAVAVHAGDITLPPLRRVGYVRGASDRVPDALLAIGVPLELLDAHALATADLGAFDTIVIGTRAYETEPALAPTNDRLLAYVRGGGRLVVQYQQYPFVRGGFAPYPLDIARPHDRTTDERSAVRVLAPDHPLFRTPNVIAEADWDGWIQERGLYFARDFDPAYRPLLALPDPEGEWREGVLLVAPVGDGWYVYTGLAFFRQLPAGVVGAHRLFLNLLAVGETSGG